MSHLHIKNKRPQLQEPSADIVLYGIIPCLANRDIIQMAMLNRKYYNQFKETTIEILRMHYSVVRKRFTVIMNILGVDRQVEQELGYLFNNHKRKPYRRNTPLPLKGIHN